MARYPSVQFGPEEIKRYVERLEHSTDMLTLCAELLDARKGAIKLFGAVEIEQCVRIIEMLAKEVREQMRQTGGKGGQVMLSRRKAEVSLEDVIQD